MEKLTIKELAPYLPYGIRVTKEDWGKTFKMDIDGTTLNCVGIDFVLHKQAKPILRPLSDLIDGEENTPEEIQKCCWSYTQGLISKHFDVFGLIDAGLAIDINTL